MAHDSTRCTLRMALAPMAIGAIDGMRSPTPADDHRLASLMYHAYLGTVDYHGETEAQALDEVRRTFAGEYGMFIWSASRVIDHGSMLASATLITRCQGKPFVAFSMTHVEFKRQGLARACLQSAINQLLLEGEDELRLVSTVANDGAMRLYESLGFVLEH